MPSDPEIYHLQHRQEQQMALQQRQHLQCFTEEQQGGRGSVLRVYDAVAGYQILEHAEAPAPVYVPVAREEPLCQEQRMMRSALRLEAPDAGAEEYAVYVARVAGERRRERYAQEVQRLRAATLRQMARYAGADVTRV